MRCTSWGTGPTCPPSGRARRRREYHGWLDNGSRQLRELYETARIFAFVTEAENFPTVAMAAGCAIVTTRGTGCAEVVGDTALLVDPRNPRQIREAPRSRTIPHAASSSDRRLGRVSRFTWSAVARRYEEVYACRTGRGTTAQAPSAAATFGGSK